MPKEIITFSGGLICGRPLKKEISPKSMKLYLLCLNKLNITLAWVERPKINNLAVKIKNVENLSTRNNYIFAVAWFLRHLNKEVERISWLSLWEVDIKKRRDGVLENNWTGSERYKNLTIAILKERFCNTTEKIHALWDLSLSIRKNDDKLENRLIDKFQKLFLTSLYLYGEPYRNNFMGLKYFVESFLDIENPPVMQELSKNYLLQKSNGEIKVIINDFKTKKKYNQLVKTLEGESKLSWIKFRDVANIKHGDFIFRQRTQNSQSGPYSETSTHNVQNASKMVLDIPFSCNDFRHLYVIDLMKSDEYKNMTQLERIKKHESMGHTINTAQIYNRV